MLRKLANGEVYPLDGDSSIRPVSSDPDTLRQLSNVLLCSPASADLARPTATEMVMAERLARRTPDREKSCFFVDRPIVLPHVERQHVTQCNASDRYATTEDRVNDKAPYLRPFYAGCVSSCK